MAPEETDDQGAVVFGDEFVADEILARLPARCAVRCSVLSKRFRQLLASPHFWLRHRRLGPPPELPQVARLHKFGMAFEFHVVGPEFAMKHTVDVDVDANCCSYAGTCNGLVLVSGVSRGDEGQYSVEGVIFNPATREEARLSLPLPHPAGNKDVERRIFGFGYGPSSKVYKALIREVDVDEGCTRLMVVSLDGSSDGQVPTTVFSCDDDEMLCCHSLHTGDDMVYFLIYTCYVTAEERYHVEDWVTTSVLAFDVDNEVATSIPVPEGEGRNIQDFMMFEVRGRPCIYKQEGQETVVWLLTVDHRWEQLYVLLNESSQPEPGDYFAGAWDCGGGLLIAVFSASGACLYNLRQAATVKDKEGGNNRLAALSSLRIEYIWPEQFKAIWLGQPKNLFDYRPTLISPASIIGDVALDDRPSERVERTHQLDEMFLEMTQKWVLGPASDADA